MSANGFPSSLESYSVIWITTFLGMAGFSIVHKLFDRLETERDRSLEDQRSIYIAQQPRREGGEAVIPSVRPQALSSFLPRKLSVSQSTLDFL